MTTNLVIIFLGIITVGSLLLGMYFLNKKNLYKRLYEESLNTTEPLMEIIKSYQYIYGEKVYDEILVKSMKNDLNLSEI